MELEQVTPVRTHVVSLLASVVSPAVFLLPSAGLTRELLLRPDYSHIVFIAPVSLSLLYLNRRNLFLVKGGCPLAGRALVGGGLILRWTGARFGPGLDDNDQLSIVMLGLFLSWIGIFVSFYGLKAARVSLFPLLFLLLIVPLPTVIIARVIVWLQTGSAACAHFLFTGAGIPVFQQGLILSTPSLEIKIAKECSGIRSSLALLITSLVFGHLFLRLHWSKLALTAAAIPLAVVKNGIRIFTLSVLGTYVDPGFLSGTLHRSGGVVFFSMTLGLLLLLLLLLRKLERSSASRPEPRTVLPRGVPAAGISA